MYACVCACVRVCVCVCVCVCVFVCVCVCKYIQTHARTRARAHTHTHPLSLTHTGSRASGTRGIKDPSQKSETGSSSCQFEKPLKDVEEEVVGSVWGLGWTLLDRDVAFLICVLPVVVRGKYQEALGEGGWGSGSG